MDGLDLRTINGVYVGDAKYSKIYLGSKMVYPNIHYIDNGTSFYDIDTATLVINSMMTNTAYAIDQSNEITAHNDVINAIDIDWNDANIGSLRSINSTGDLLKIIDEIAEGINDLGGSSFDWEHSDLVYVTDSLTNIPIGQHPRYIYLTGDISTNYINPSSSRYYGRTNTDGILEWDIKSGYGTPEDEWYVKMLAITRMYKWNDATQQYENWIPTELVNSHYEAIYSIKYRINEKAMAIQIGRNYRFEFTPFNRDPGTVYELYMEYVGPDGVTYRSDFDIKVFRNL